MKPFIIQTTCSTKKEASFLSRLLVKKNLTACVQRSKIKSIYEWNGKLCEDREYLLTIKTKKENYKQIKREIKENHIYDRK